MCMPAGQSQQSLIECNNLFSFTHHSVSYFLPRNLISPILYKIVGFYSSEYEECHILVCNAM